MKTINPLVHFSLFDNRYDNTVSNHHELLFSELVALIRGGHKITENKDTTLFGPWKFKKEGDMRRCADNVELASVICLDFDGGLSLSAAKGMFSTYLHCGYTSYRHKINGDDDHRFRVVLPLAKPATPDEIVDRRESIYAWAKGIDPSSLSIARSFYVPACPEERKQFAESWDNHSEDLFDIFEFEKRPEYVAPANVESIDTTDADRRWLIDSLKSIYVGAEPVWYNVGVAMYSNGFELTDYIEVTVGGLMREKSVHDCEIKWKAIKGRTSKSDGISIGFLYNLLKKHGISRPAKHKKSIKTLIHEKIMGRS